MKKEYKLEMEIIEFDTEDVITDSTNVQDGNESGCVTDNTNPG